MVKKKAVSAKEKIFLDLSHKVRQALGALIGDNSTLFVTPADVADRVMDGVTNLSAEDIDEIHNRVGVMAQMFKQGRCNIFRTGHKIQPRSIGRKAQFGYRIGPALAPLRITDVRRDEKLSAEAAVAALEDPVAFLLSIKEQLPIIKINSLIVELVNELQSRVMAQHVQMVELDKRMKDLSEDFRALSIVPNPSKGE